MWLTNGCPAAAAYTGKNRKSQIKNPHPSAFCVLNFPQTLNRKYAPPIATSVLAKARPVSPYNQYPMANKVP